jgi:hypothetical protein
MMIRHLYSESTAHKNNFLTIDDEGEAKREAEEGESDGDEGEAEHEEV